MSDPLRGALVSTSLILGALLTGLVGSPHCVGMCGGFAGAASEDRPSAVAYHAGRAITYATLGAAVGAAGAVLPGPGWLPAIPATALIVVFAASLGGWVEAPHVSLPGVGRFAQIARAQGGWAGKVGFGAATALLPCGLVYGALGLAVAAGSAVGGALTMAVFWTGTVPLLAGASAGLRRWAAGSLLRRRMLAMAVLTVGLWSVGARTLLSLAP